MKKLLSLVCFSLLATIALGGNYELYDRVKADYEIFKTNRNMSVFSYMTDDMWIQYVDELLARAKELGITEHVPYSIMEPFGVIVTVSNNLKTDKDRNAFIDSYDNKFVNTPYLFDNSYYMSWFPKTLSTYMKLHPEKVNKWIVNYTLTLRYSKTVGSKRPCPARLNTLIERNINGSVTDEDIVSKIFSGLVKPIRKKLREQGKSFVVGPDGKNPVQDEIDRFAATLDNPNCAGMKELVLEYFPDYEWVDPVAMTVDEVIELKNKVFIGELELTPSIKLKLKTALGLVEFNKFIDSYNGNN